MTQRLNKLTQRLNSNKMTHRLNLIIAAIDLEQDDAPVELEQDDAAIELEQDDAAVDSVESVSEDGAVPVDQLISQGRDLLVVTERVWTENQASIEAAIRDTTDVYVLRGVADAERFASTMDGKQRFGCVGLLAHGNFDETTQTAELLGIRVSVDPASVEPKRLIVNDLLTVIRGYTRHRLDIFACDVGNGVAVRNLVANADAILRFPGGISLSSDVTGPETGWRQDWNTRNGWRARSDDRQPEADTYFADVEALDFNLKATLPKPETVIDFAI